MRRICLSTLLVFVFWAPCFSAPSGAGLSADGPVGRRGWFVPEFTLRYDMQLFTSSAYLTAGTRLSRDNVLGVALGVGSRWYDDVGEEDRRGHLALYYRHYFPLDAKRRLFAYGDILLGGSYVYEVSCAECGEDVAEKGSFDLCGSLQPGFAVRVWRSSNVFIGLSLFPTFGIHGGITLGF